MKENGHFSKGSYVCAGSLAYTRTHLKPKLQNKKKIKSDDSGISSGSSNVAKEIISEPIKKELNWSMTEMLPNSRQKCFVKHLGNQWTYYLPLETGRMGQHVSA